MKTKLLSPKPFWMDLLLIWGGVTVVAFFVYIIFRDSIVVSNIYFMASFVLWLVAIIPAVSEIGGNTKLIMKARKKGVTVRDMLEAQEDQYRKGGRITYLFGISGMICFLSAFFSIGL